MGERGLEELLEQRQIYLDDIAESKEALSLINAEIDQKCAKVFQEKRGKTGKEYGVVTVTIEDYEVKQTVGKTVTWDQAALEGIAQKIAAANDDPNQWMVKSWKVKEKDFKDWSPDIQAVFLPARTVKPKTPTYDFKELW